MAVYNSSSRHGKCIIGRNPPSLEKGVVLVQLREKYSYQQHPKIALIMGTLSQKTGIPNICSELLITMDPDILSRVSTSDLFHFMLCRITMCRWIQGLIVFSNSGAKEYRRWLGSQVGFEAAPVAFIVPIKKALEKSEDQDESLIEDSQPARTHSEKLLPHAPDVLPTPERNRQAAMAKQILDASAQQSTSSHGLHTPSDSDNAVHIFKRANAEPRNALAKGKRPTKDSDLPPRVAPGYNIGSDGKFTSWRNAKRRKTDISTRESNRLGEPSRRHSDFQHPVSGY